MPALVIPVRELARATGRTRLVRLGVDPTAFAFEAGQAVMVGLHGAPLRKPYSIASSPTDLKQTGLIDLLLQVEDSGLDPHLERATVGTALDLEGPFGSFGIPAGAPPPTLFVAGGTGIAPLRSLMREWLAGAAPPPMGLVFTARTADELAFRDELDTLNQAGRLRLRLTLTRNGEAGWTGTTGRLDAALLRSALPAPNACCVACGPVSLIQEVRRLLPEVGIPASRYHTQRA